MTAKPRFDSPCDALALMLDDLRALREALSHACELHEREPALAAHERSAALVTQVRESLRRQNTEGETVRAELKITAGVALKSDEASSALVAEFLLRLRKPERSLILRDVSTLLNVAGSELTILHSAALALKEDDVARLALRHLAELTPFVMEISQLLPAAAVADLASRSVVADPLASEIARANVLEAWRNEPPANL